jgi:hypothetical protein
MPNGDPGFDVEELEQFFSPLAATLATFNKRHFASVKGLRVVEPR